ncbi:MAG TPA: PQQ-dependent sugar dehydrogenase [Flavobacterium sp.]|jgi:glucose/arabinose dehydrogenase
MKKITLLLGLLLMVSAQAQELEILAMASGFSNAVEITNAGDERLFVVQQTGAIKIVNPDGSVNPTNFLTLTTSTISTGGERGLLGLAFHPDYAENGEFYVNYTRAGDGATVIARYQVSDNPNIADASSATILMEIGQPFSNHNGGTIKFGPDGYLYIGMGDGGSGGDPGNRAQNISNNLGKMLRINVDNTDTYTNPDTNPFVGIEGNDEIWAIGLRNPWKFSFNRLNGDLWIADVGQNEVEEINHIENPLTPGLNFGWRCYEGNEPFNTSGCPSASTLTMPTESYTHSATGGCSITGGYEYTGVLYPNLQGKYLFSDFCVPKIGVLDSEGDVAYTDELSGIDNITTFGEDIVGELYVIGSTGILYRIIDVSLGNSEMAQAGFAVYPNPARGEVNIKNSSQKQLKHFSLYDLSGKRLLDQDLNDVEVNTIQTSILSSGLYIISVEDTTGAKYSSRLMIK